MTQVLDYVIPYLLHFATVLFIARFLLQACRADFYNPLSQGIIKATDPLLKPMRRLIPGYRNLDFSSILVTVLLQILLAVALTAINGSYLGTVVSLITNSMLQVAWLLLNIWRFAIIIVIVASFIAPGSHHPALTLLSQITEPLLGPARRLIPPMGGLDFSPILVFLVIGVVLTIIPQLQICPAFHCS